MTMTEPLNPQPDPQDPLPEASFKWRRLLTFALCIGFLALLWAALHLLAQGDVLSFAQGIMLLMALICTFYYAGASATDIAGLLAVLKLRLRGPRTDDATSPNPPKP